MKTIQKTVINVSTAKKTVELVERELNTLPEHLSLVQVFIWVHVA